MIGGKKMDGYYYMSKEPFLDGGVPVLLVDIFEITLNMYNKFRNNTLMELRELEESNINGANDVEILKKLRVIRQIQEMIDSTISEMKETPIDKLTCVIEIDYPDGHIKKVPYYYNKFEQ